MLQGFLAKLMFEDCTKKTNQFMANTKACKKKFEKRKIKFCNWKLLEERKDKYFLINKFSKKKMQFFFEQLFS